MSRDDTVEKIYRAGSAEQPSAAADAAILALAREATGAAVGGAAASNKGAEFTPFGAAATSAPPVAQASLLRRWRAPLGLAASLVLAVGIVSRVQIEETAGTAPGAPPPAAPVAGPVAASVTPPSTAEGVKKVTGTTNMRAAESSAANAKAGGPRDQTVEARQPAASTAIRSERRAEAKEAIASADAPIPFPAQAGGTSASAPGTAKPDAQSPPQSLRKAAAPHGASASELADLAAPAAVATQSAPTPAFPAATAPASAAEERARMSASTLGSAMQREATAKSRAATTLQGAVPTIAQTGLTEALEATLTPEQWLRRIIEARQAGRHDEADASLARLLVKEASISVPPEARRPAGRPSSQ